MNCITRVALTAEDSATPADAAPMGQRLSYL
ncbi:MAG: hypothetical protein QOH63_3365 [Acidobacteriota bacterium]|nr:hypothetical protein [Acidobacteriota bacterium]